MAARGELEASIVKSEKKARMRNILLMAEAIFEKDDDGGVEMQEMEDIINARPDLRDLLMTCGLPRGFDIGDLHLIFDEDHGGTVDKEEFVTGMFRLIFNNEFQRDCCTLLTVAQVKAELKAAMADMKDDFKLLLAKLDGKVAISVPQLEASVSVREEKLQPKRISFSRRQEEKEEGRLPPPACAEMKEDEQFPASPSPSWPEKEEEANVQESLGDVPQFALHFHDRLEHTSLALKAMQDAHQETRRCLEEQLSLLNGVLRSHPESARARSLCVRPSKPERRRRSAGPVLLGSQDYLTQKNTMGPSVLLPHVAAKKRLPAATPKVSNMDATVWALSRL